jgi:hypothetical protein
MADKEFTQICKEILAASEKISPLAEQAGKLGDEFADVVKTRPKERR